MRTKQPEAVQGLHDYISDGGEKVPGGKQQRYWRTRLDLSPSRIGVDAIKKDVWRHKVDAALLYFGLRSIEFGNYMTQLDRAHHLYGAMSGLDDMARVMRVNPREMSLDSTLSIALGARGVPDAAAHYEVIPNVVINLTKFNGKGSLAHEYAHALDNYAGKHLAGMKMSFLSRRTPFHGINRDDLNTTKPSGVMEHIFYTLTETEAGRKTAFGAAIDKLKEVGRDRYYKMKHEIFARSFEAWMSYKLEHAGIHNGFVVPKMPISGRTFLYPSRALVMQADRYFTMLVRMIYEHVEQQANVDDDSTDDRKSASTPRTATIRTTDGPIPGRYALVELADLITSHDPQTWSPDPRYPHGCQQRDYSRDSAEQAKVSRGAQQLEPALMITDTPSPVDGPPIVTRQGSQQREYIVLGGNGRTMMLRLSVSMGTYAPYRKLLGENARYYDLDPGQIDSMQHPVLVRVIEADMQRCAYWSNVLNRGLTQSIDISTEAFALARQISPKALELVAEAIAESGAETIADLFADPRASRTLVGTLRRAHIINDTNVSQFLDRNGQFDAQGKLRAQTILLGALLQDVRLTDLARVYTAQILRSVPVLLQIQNLGSQWDLMPLVRLAIETESERRAAGTPKDRFLSQTSLVRGDVPANVRAVWDALDSGARAFASFAERYFRRAQIEAQGDGFGLHTPASRDDILQSLTTVAVHTGRSLEDVMSTPARRPIILSEFGEFLGDDIVEPTSILIWGESSQGKSYLSTLLADDLGSIGTTLFNTPEEPETRPTFRRRIETLGVSLRNVDIQSIREWTAFIEYIRKTGPRFVVVDSIPYMATYERELAMHRLWLDHKDICTWVFVGRANKEGGQGGSSRWWYDADIRIHVDNFKATIQKHRFMDPEQWQGKSYDIRKRRAI